MTRLITKQMRDSFKVSAGCRVNKFIDYPSKMCPATYFQKTKKQRILILKGTIK